MKLSSIKLFAAVAEHEHYALTIDLAAQTILQPDGTRVGFTIEAHRKHCLLHGLDDIGLTLRVGR